MNNEELLNENAKLNAIIDGYQPKIQALKDEKDKYYQQTLDDEIQINELLHTLQEIKTIAEELLEKGLEPQSVEYQLRLRGKRELASIILDLITKAESEG